MMLSVLDQGPTRVGDPPGEALRGAIRLARHVDGLGFARLWIAEHHGVGAFQTSAPEVVLGTIAAQTRRLRAGSGGMLLPNHRPLHVAEQFRVLEALYPGRIDLGIGRSAGAGSAPTMRALQRRSDDAHGSGFDRQLAELLAFGDVAPLPADDPLAEVRATPDGVALPPAFLLGSSLDSAATAARHGLGYAYATFSNPDATVASVRRYREQFTPSRMHARPHAILAVRVVVGEDDEHAQALAAPGRLAMAQARAGLGIATRLPSVDAALAHRWTDAEREADALLGGDTDVVGGAEHVRERIERIVADAQADEAMIITNTSDPDARLASFTRLAVAFELAVATSSPSVEAGR
jgi:luciferase family oxidoreductase group 1